MTVAETIAAVPAWNWALQVIGLATSYAGAELNARMRISGFIVWLASNIVMATLHAASGLWVLLVLDALFFRVNAMGLMRWTREQPQNAPAWLRRFSGCERDADSGAGRK